MINISSFIKLKSNLVDYNQDTLESSLDFTHEDEDMFIGIMQVYLKL